MSPVIKLSQCHKQDVTKTRKNDQFITLFSPVARMPGMIASFATSMRNGGRQLYPSHLVMNHQHISCLMLNAPQTRHGLESEQKKKCILLQRQTKGTIHKYCHANVSHFCTHSPLSLSNHATYQQYYRHIFGNPPLSLPSVISFMDYPKGKYGIEQGRRKCLSQLMLRAKCIVCICCQSCQPGLASR